jgi:hypothetical protein
VIRLLALLSCAVMFCPQMTRAQTVTECDARSQAGFLVEPWENYSRSFADGLVRVAVLNTVDPAPDNAHLLVLSPPFDDMGQRQCRIVSYVDGMGFAGLYFREMKAVYDADTGLSLAVPVHGFDPARGFAHAGLLTVTLDTTTGDVTAGFVQTPE